MLRGDLVFDDPSEPRAPFCEKCRDAETQYRARVCRAVRIEYFPKVPRPTCGRDLCSELRKDQLKIAKLNDDVSALFDAVQRAKGHDVHNQRGRERMPGEGGRDQVAALLAVGKRAERKGL